MDQAIVIGLDGMEPSLWTKWADEGHLPNVAAMRSEGAYGTAHCSTLSSAAQWTTHFTGVTSAVHGVTGFERDSPGGADDRELITLRDIGARTYPEILDDRGLRVGLVNPLPLWPPVELDNGFCISGILTLPDAETWTHPDSLAAELEEFGYRIDIRYQDRPYGFMDDGIVGDVGLDTLWEDMSDVLETRIAYAKQALREDDPEVFYVLYKSIDVIQHVFWAPMEAGDPEYGTAIREAYAMVDEFIGWVRENRPDANILVLGDHGFRARRDQPAGVDSIASTISRLLPTVPAFLERLYHEATKDTGRMDADGFQIDHLSGAHDNPTAWLMSGPDVTSTEELAVDFEDLTPSLYTLLDEPIPEAYAGTPITDALAREPTYDDTAVAMTRETTVDDGVSERLYNLGYVDMVEDS
jgi:hypothetical protein